MPAVTETKQARSYLAMVTTRRGPREVLVMPQYWLPGYTPAHKSTPAEAIRHLYESLINQAAQAGQDAELAIRELEKLKKESTT